MCITHTGRVQNLVNLELLSQQVALSHCFINPELCKGLFILSHVHLIWLMHLYHRQLGEQSQLEVHIGLAPNHLRAMYAKRQTIHTLEPAKASPPPPPLAHHRQLTEYEVGRGVHLAKPQSQPG